MYLNVWSLVDGTVWEALGNVPMMEEVCLSALRFQKPSWFPVIALSASWLLSPVMNSELLL